MRFKWCSMCVLFLRNAHWSLLWNWRKEAISNENKWNNASMGKFLHLIGKKWDFARKKIISILFATSNIFTDCTNFDVRKIKSILTTTFGWISTGYISRRKKTFSQTKWSHSLPILIQCTALMSPHFAHANTHKNVIECVTCSANDYNPSPS